MFHSVRVVIFALVGLTLVLGYLLVILMVYLGGNNSVMFVALATVMVLMLVASIYPYIVLRKVRKDEAS